MPIEAEHPLRPLCKAWLEKKNLAVKHKRAKFQEFADECMAFFNGPHTFMWDSDYMYGKGKKRGFVSQGDDDEESIAPTFRFTMNKIAEGVQLFGPALYARNPVRQVTPRKLPAMTDAAAALLPPELAMVSQMPPEMQQTMQPQMMALQQFQQQMAAQQAAYTQENAVKSVTAELISTLQNYTPNETDLKGESRMVIDETIIKGMGNWWTELYEPYPGAAPIIGSFYDTFDNTLYDPDVERVKDCTFIIRECTHPIWQVEDEYGWERGSIKDSLKESGSRSARESLRAQAENSTDPDEKNKRKKGEANDTITYWKIYSKMGMGDRLTGVDPDFKDTLDELGDYCYIVVAEGIPCPLNLPDSLLNAAPKPDPLGMVDEQAMQAWKESVFNAVQWPIPFWADGDWPCTELCFHQVPNCVYGMGHFMPGLGELRWLNWAMSFLANKVRTSCGTYIGVLKAAGEELKKQILSGGDQKVVELENIFGRSISDVVSFLQQPPFHGDIYNVIAAVAEVWEKRVGLTELAYGQTGSQYRSAAEANVKQANYSIRPEDMASCVEDAMTRLARKEAIASRYLLSGEQLVPILGRAGASLWDQFVATKDMDYIIREFDYRIEAGSARKPNKTTRIDQMNAAVQSWGPVLSQWAMGTGNVQPLNALLEDWCKAMDIDATRYMLPPPPPPPQVDQGESPGTSDQEAQQDMAIKEAEHKQRMKHKDAENKAAIAAKKKMAAASGNGKK